MRFIENGPSIPDSLLVARDAGQVLIFCGAGVSMAEAQLPDFVRLAERVHASLGSVVPFDKGIAVDRIFGRLEREFETAEVREAVAMELKPKHGYGLGAHRTILDLSRTRGGEPRLVTTNFDRLFEECEPDSSYPSFNPPRLPDPRRDGDFRGIIHLHGCVNAQYTGAQDDEFVLSSADFGHAYLSDGWATRYIQSLLQRFKIVFVGYQAGDPPVQYLLEALNRFSKPPHGLYAFQSGDTASAAEQWAHKGVEPICYASAGSDHSALWQSLSAWAERARDVDGWHERLLVKASQGPAVMAPYERGMIAHLVSTTNGTNLLTTSQTILPADWLYVIDRGARYGKTHRASRLEEVNADFDPFDVYCLDSDTPPAPIDPTNRFAAREIPEDAWDGFVLTPADRMNLPVECTAPLKVHAGSLTKLPPRLRALGNWIAKIAYQPAALWWSAKQSPFHPDIQEQIEWSMRNESARYSPAVRDGWRFLLTCWRQPVGDRSLGRYAIEAQAKTEGWSPALVRKTIALYQPVLSVRPSISDKAPEPHPELTLKDILWVDVDYPRPHELLGIPSHLLGYAVKLFRQQLEFAVQLEREVSGHDNIYFDTIRPDDGEELDEDGHGLTGHVAIFTNMVVQLSQVDTDAARREVRQWLEPRDKLFTRLRIWAAAHDWLTTPEEAGEVFLALDDDAFWGSHERDLMYALRDRWVQIPESVVSALEIRLREGHVPWSEQEGRDEHIAHYRLNLLHWLATQGVNFSFDLKAETAKLQAVATDWTEDATKHFAQPHIGKVFSIKTDTSAGPLAQLPIGKVLEAAEVLGQRQFDSHINRQPFHGFAKERPARALSVLTDAERKGKFVPWAWRAILTSDGGTAVSPRLLSVTGHRLARLSLVQLSEIAHPVSEWLINRGELLFSERSNVFDLVFDALVTALKTGPDEKQSSRSDRRWVDESLNRPAGRVVDAVFKDPIGQELIADQGLPISWTRRFDQLLGLPSNHRLHAIVMIAYRLKWLFSIDSTWVVDRLLPFADDQGENGQAFWAGFLSAARVPQNELYLQLKPRLVSLSMQRGLRREQSDTLAGILLDGWCIDEDMAESQRLISNRELREVLVATTDNLRAKTLWYLKHWTQKPDSRWNKLLLPFLTQVWPRQRAVRTARMSDRLIDLAIGIPDQFPEIAAAILPRLVTIETSSWVMNSLIHTDTKIVDTYPETVLDLLWAILPENSSEWPDGTSAVIGLLSNKAETQTDPRLIELLRRQQQPL